MPPRVRGPSLPLVGFDAAASSRATPFTRTFSTTPSCEKMSRARYEMYQWLLKGNGRKFAQAGTSPNYLGPHLDQPFPNNPLFRSQPVLDDTTKDLIWEKVIVRGEALKAVSAEMGVDVRRVAAVVRLKEVEKQWQRDGKELATQYAKAVMKMLPKTSYREGIPNQPHEPVNEVHVHKATMQQLFVPVSESRHFTREDAAQAFHDKLFSADKRSPQPGLIRMEREILEGATREKSMERFKEAAQKEEDDAAAKLVERQQIAESKMTRIDTDRYEFRFQEINAENVGRDGKSPRGVGWRYGAPFDDRKRGLVKIPTSVP